MFRNHLNLIFRNFKRHKTSFFINLLGLSTGLACVLLIYLWVNDELHVDKFHENDTRLFQIMENTKNSGGISTDGTTPGVLAEALAIEMPEIEYAVSSTDPGEYILSVGNEHIKAYGICGSKDFFNIFSYNLLQGNKNQMLADKSTIVISEELAKKLFSNANDIIGKTISWQYLHFKNEYVISGIFKGTPKESSTQFDFVLSWKSYKDMVGKYLHWGNHSSLTYVTLKKGTNTQQFNDKIANFLKSKNTESNTTLFLKKYSEKYLYGRYENGVQDGGRIEYLRLFSLIAIFILVIACINFMNLSTAKASKRIKEVGIKKVIGVRRKSIISQYMGESLLMTFLSLLIAIIIIVFLLPQFNKITGKQISLNFNVNMVFSFLGIIIFTGLISGSYPALYLSGFNPATVLKGKFRSSVGELWARKGLVVFQFTLSVILIVAVLIVYKQIAYIQTKNLGYNKDNIIHFQREGKLTESLGAFLSEVKYIPGILNASSIEHSLVRSGSNTSDISWRGKNLEEQIPFENVAVDYNTIETLGINIKEGRSFSQDFGSDNSKIIFNEAAIKAMRLTNPIGEMIRLWGSDRQIIGVVKDFHFASLHENIKPMFMRLSPETKTILIKIKTGNEKETLHKLEKFYTKFNPGFPFEYQYLDKEYQDLYAAENRVSILSRYFAGLAIFISCLGLFGLAAFTAERRRKEVGIRKVFGSSELDIIYLLSGDFTKLVLVSFFISLPVSFVLARLWLNSFAYSIDLKIWYFLGAGLITIFIVWLTVGVQTIKATRINPAQCLKDE